MEEETQKKLLANLLTKEPHSACIVGITGAGKSVLALDLLESYYKDVFKHIIILCETLQHNRAYKERAWVGQDPRVIMLNPGERLHEILRVLFKRFQGSPTFYLLDDLSTTESLT